MAEIRALHERVIGIATQGDAAWFEKNPDSRIRMRNAVPMEFKQNLGDAPVGMSWRAIVVEAQPGVRARQPIALPLNTENDAFTEEVLFGLFLQAAPAETKGIVDRLRKMKIGGVPKPSTR